MRERHILPRHMTNVTRHIFCHRKKWQMWRHSPKSETGSWEEIRVRPTLSPVIRLGLRTPRKKERKNAPSMMHSQSHLGCHFRKLKAHSSNVSFAMFRCKETFELWALSFETAFENVTPSGIGYTRRAGWPSLTFTPGKVLQACGTRWHHWKLNGNELNCVLKKKKSPNQYTSSPGRNAKQVFSGFILINKQTNKQTNFLNQETKNHALGPGTSRQPYYCALLVRRVLKDFRWFIRHHHDSSVVESAALEKCSNP